MSTHSPSSASSTPSPGGAELSAVLARIDARIANLERVLAPAGELSANASNALATLIDAIDEKAAKLGDLEGRLAAVGDVIERLSRPRTMGSLRNVVDLAENAPGLVATFVDVVDEAMAEAGAQGLELAQVVDNARRLLLGLLRLTTSPELRALLDSGMLDPRALESLGQVASALVRARQGAAAPVGMLGALRALGNPDVQRALGLVLQVAANFGRALGEPEPASPSPQRLTAGS